jgi:HEPN domain-containing protein
MAETDALALAAIARRDLLAAQGMTEPTTFHEAVWGFQVQQTIEKALKAWLYLLGVEPPFTLKASRSPACSPRSWRNRTDITN